MFHGAYIHGLAIVTQPVAKVDSFDVHLAELLAAHGTCGEYGEEGVFDVAMAPIDSFNFGNGANVACSKGVRGACEKDEGEEEKWEVGGQ